MIRYDFSIEDLNKYQKGELPENAVKIETPETIDETMKKSTPIMVVFSILLSCIAVYKFVSGQIALNPLEIISGIILGIMIGLILLFVHEILHAIVYPKDASVTVGKLKGKFVFVALASYPMKRIRFILMSLLPFILGIVPLFLFVFSMTDHSVLNGILFGMAVMGMISPSADVLNVRLVLKQADKDNYIMFYGDDIYKI